MNGPNPYEAPRHMDRPRRGPRRERSTDVGCVFSLLGGVGGFLLGAEHPAVKFGEAAGLPLLAGLLGAFLAGIAGHFIGLAVAEPPSLLDPVEAEAEAKREKILAEIAVAQSLLDQAERDGDEEVRDKLAAYKAKLEQKLRA